MFSANERFLKTDSNWLNSFLDTAVAKQKSVPKFELQKDEMMMKIKVSNMISYAYFIRWIFEDIPDAR